jgi:hypothetical protein
VVLGCHLGTAEIKGDEDLNASFELSGLELFSLPLDKVNDSVRANSRVGDALTNHPDDLFVILESAKDALGASRCLRSKGESEERHGLGESDVCLRREP